MAFVHGKTAVLSLDNGSASLTDISAYLDGVTYSPKADTGETTTFGATAKTYLAGLKDATIKLQGKFDSALATILSDNLGASATKTFEFGPEGSASGKFKFTGECIVTGFEVDSPVGDIVTMSAELQVTGAVTATTY